MFSLPFSQFFAPMKLITSHHCNSFYIESLFLNFSSIKSEQDPNLSICFMDLGSIFIIACMHALTEYKSGAQFRSIQANFPHGLSLTWVDKS